jgi:hypothetical protein
MTKFRLFVIAQLSILLCSLAVPVRAQVGIQLVSNDVSFWKAPLSGPSSRLGQISLWWCSNMVWTS